MMKQDEEALLLALAAVPEKDYVFARDVVNRLWIPERRAEYIFNKWINKKKWYECGVSVFSGWLLPAGRKAAQEIKDSKPKLSQRTGMLKSFDEAFQSKPMDEATVNAAVDWLMEQGSTLFDVCVAFASAPYPEKGWQWVLARFDRLTNGEEKYSSSGKRRCNEIRQMAMLPDSWTLYFGGALVPSQRGLFVNRTLEHLSYDIDVKKVVEAAKVLLERGEL
jgi:hypothetical protein